MGTHHTGIGNGTPAASTLPLRAALETVLAATIIIRIFLIPDRDPFFGEWAFPQASAALYRAGLGSEFSQERIHRAPRVLTIAGGEENAELIIMDTRGARVLISSVPAARITKIPLLSLSPGVYLARLVEKGRDLTATKIRVGF